MLAVLWRQRVACCRAPHQPAACRGLHQEKRREACGHCLCGCAHACCCMCWRPADVHSMCGVLEGGGGHAPVLALRVLLARSRRVSDCVSVHADCPTSMQQHCAGCAAPPGLSNDTYTRVQLLHALVLQARVARVSCGQSSRPCAVLPGCSCPCSWGHARTACACCRLPSDATCCLSAR